MDNIQTHLNAIEQWNKELVPVSKKDIVHELYSRTKPIFTTLLTLLRQQERRISILEEKIDKN